MNAFIDDRFLIANRAAIDLYENFARGQPIFDYHSHLSAEQIADDIHFENITRLWLAGDHYKWRLMRSNGVEERLCTGDATDREKFEAWARTVPRMIGNPLYHWAHMELRDPFGITDRLLNEKTASAIWDECNEMLREPHFSSRWLLHHFNVTVACTTDDPADSLGHHERLAMDLSTTERVLPTFRPDKAMAVEVPETFNAWVDKLACSAGIDIGSFNSFLDALHIRHDFFHRAGCRVSDHGLEQPYAGECSSVQARTIFDKVRSGRKLDKDEIVRFKSAMMIEFGMMDHEKNWVMQIHCGALRNTNSRKYAAIGPDTGFDTIADGPLARPLARFLDSLDKIDKLPKTILYNLNPADCEMMAAMAGNFQDGTVPGKIQYGAAWWFCDHKSGIERQLDTIANLGLLGNFVGMTTDSRSFLSFVRHDYFRRILCNRLGSDMELGLIPTDMELVGNMVLDICWRNAAGYFGFDGGSAGENRKSP